jgi:hypothetical protein
MRAISGIEISGLHNLAILGEDWWIFAYCCKTREKKRLLANYMFYVGSEVTHLFFLLQRSTAVNSRNYEASSYHFQLIPYIFTYKHDVIKNHLYYMLLVFFMTRLDLL